jgi:hypothetical protein
VSYKKPRAEFNWPPTEDELGQYSNTLDQGEIGFDEAGFDTGDLPVAPAQEERSTTPAVTGPRDTASEGTRTGEWAAELARLQALIEGLTQKDEWR